MHRHTLISKNRTRSVLGGSLLFLRLSKTPLALLFPSLTLLLKDESCRYVSKGLTTIFLFCPFSLWFIVWKSTRRSYPSIYTQVCIWKSCSEKGKKKNNRNIESEEMEFSCWEWKCSTGASARYFSVNLFSVRLMGKMMFLGTRGHRRWGWVRVLTRWANGARGVGRGSRSFNYQLSTAIPETFVGITGHLVVLADKVPFYNSPLF